MLLQPVMQPIGIHFNYDQVRKAFSEVQRVLKTGGQFLFSYHAADEIVHFDIAHNREIDIDLRLLLGDSKIV